jgi:hypothetical protein
MEPSAVWLAVAPLITVLAMQGTQRYEESTGTVANAAYFDKLRLVSIALSGLSPADGPFTAGVVS